MSSGCSGCGAFAGQNNCRDAKMTCSYKRLYIPEERCSMNKYDMGKLMLGEGRYYIETISGYYLTPTNIEDFCEATISKNGDYIGFRYEIAIDKDPYIPTCCKVCNYLNLYDCSSVVAKPTVIWNDIEWTQIRLFGLAKVWPRLFGTATGIVRSTTSPDTGTIYYVIDQSGGIQVIYRIVHVMGSNVSVLEQMIGLTISIKYLETKDQRSDCGMMITILNISMT